MTYPIEGPSSQPYGAYGFNTPIGQRRRRQQIHQRENIADAYTWNAAKTNQYSSQESGLKGAAPGAAQNDAPESWLNGRKFAVLIDAGSSGSRMQVYSWKDPKLERALRASKKLSTTVLPKVEKGTWENSGVDWSLKKEPGLSSFGDHPADVGAYLKDLLDHAETIVPPSVWAETPIYVMATAGMRLLPVAQQEAVLTEVCRYIREHTSFNIDGARCSEHVQVISGEEEGLLGWIAINYLMDGFHLNGKKTSLDGEMAVIEGKSTFGFLDMGGASSQIAFEPSNEALQGEGAAAEGELTSVSLRMLDGTEVSHKVFVTTFLGYGTNQARQRHIEHLSNSGIHLEISLEDGSSKEMLPDPCLPQGLQLPTIEGKGNLSLIGTGNFTSCLESVHPLLDKEEACTRPPCLFHGVHAPKIDFSVNHFIGVSEYWFSSNDVFGLGGVYDFVAFQKAAKTFCSKPWSELKHHLDAGDLFGPEVQLNRLQTQCFKAAWMVTVLHEGIGIPRIVDNNGSGDGTDHADEAQGKGERKNLFQSVNDVQGFSVSWTLGKAVREASRDIPPAPGSLSSSFDDFSKSRSKLGKWDPFGTTWPTTGEGSAFPPTLGPGRHHVEPTSLVVLVAFFFVLLLTCICTRGRGPRASRRRAAVKELLPPPLGSFGGLCNVKRIGRGDYVLVHLEEANGTANQSSFWSKLTKRTDDKPYSPTMETEFIFTSESSSEESGSSAVGAGLLASLPKKRMPRGLFGAFTWQIRRVTLMTTSLLPMFRSRGPRRRKMRDSTLPTTREREATGESGNGYIAPRGVKSAPTTVRLSRPGSPTFTGLASGTAISRPVSSTSSRAPTPTLGHRLTSASLSTRPVGMAISALSPSNPGSPLGERISRPGLFAASLSRTQSHSDVMTSESGLLAAPTARTPARQATPALQLTPMPEIHGDDN